MASNDLTTLNMVKAWFMSQQGAAGSTLGDPVISREITRVSQAMLAWMGRDTIGVRVYNDRYDGTGQAAMMLRRYPVLQINDPVVVSNTAIAPGIPNTVGPITVTNGGVGYYLDQWDGVLPGSGQLIELRGARFWGGRQNVSISYLAGYATLDEAWTVPATFQITPNSINGILTADYRVKYAATGVLLTAMPVGTLQSALTAGQYVPPSNFAVQAPLSYYQFATGDVGQDILISYSYVPDMLEGACCEVVCERLAYRTRIGLKAKTISGNETMAYDLSAFHDWVNAILQPYKMVTPL